MSTQVLDVLKQALLLERRGRAFYQQVAAQTPYAPVRDFFQAMADEEHRHMLILEAQFKSYSEHSRLEFDAAQNGDAHVVEKVLTAELKKQIAAAGFEAAAIAAAMLMEEQALTLYADRARTVKDPGEKELYRWLANWEHGHLTLLAGLERDIREQVWNDRQFWPY